MFDEKELIQQSLKKYGDLETARSKQRGNAKVQLNIILTK